MQKLTVYLSTALLFCACNQKSVNDKAEVVSNETKIQDTSSNQNLNESIKDVELKSAGDMIGLWTGSFLQTDFQKQIQELADSLQEKYMEGEEAYNIKAINKLPPQGQKLFFKNSLFGDYEMKMPNKLSIIIESISDGEVEGRSICAGNERAITGTYTRKGNAFTFKASEPGDDKNDGTFEFVVDLDSNTTIGKWTPMDATQESKKFELTRKEFVYAPLAQEWDWDKDFVNKNISTQVLKTKDVENQSQQHLRVLRNLIYARHGYSFKQSDIRQQFEIYDWYTPISADVREQLTDTEKQNEALLKRYEQYAKSYYDDYGR